MNLKNTLILMAGIAFASSVYAEKSVASPKGGRVLENAPQQTEFFVNAERKAEINFYDARSKPIEPGERAVTISAEPKSGRAPLEVERTKTGFVTKQPLPAGEPYRVVVQVREKPEAKPKNFRVQFDLSNCAECSHPEYACICGH